MQVFFGYTVLQWLSFFMSYCIFGWIFECIYCSLKSGKLLNRGFCHGPWIPLYGFGATLLLMFANPCQDKRWLVFLIGFCGGTALELATGLALDRIFRMRWWDYSHTPLNFHGYISFFSSLGWGILALFIIEYIHPRIAGISKNWNYTTFLVVNTMLYTLLLEDAAASTAAALDLKRRIEQAAANSEEIELIRLSIQELYAKMGEAKAGLIASKDAVLEIQKNEGNLAAAKAVAAETVQATRSMGASTMQAARSVGQNTVQAARSMGTNTVQAAKAGIGGLTKDARKALAMQKEQMESWLAILQEGGNGRTGRMSWWSSTMIRNNPELLSNMKKPESKEIPDLLPFSEMMEDEGSPKLFSHAEIAGNESNSALPSQGEMMESGDKPDLLPHAE